MTALQLSRESNTGLSSSTIIDFTPIKPDSVLVDSYSSGQEKVEIELKLLGSVNDKL